MMTCDIVFTCDGCEDALNTVSGDLPPKEGFAHALQVLRNEEWRSIKKGDQWFHFCPRCEIPT